jgi:hypothetical protein
VPGFIVCVRFIFLIVFSGTADKEGGVYHTSFISLFREGNITFSGVNLDKKIRKIYCNIKNKL